MPPIMAMTFSYWPVRVQICRRAVAERLVRTAVIVEIVEAEVALRRRHQLCPT